MGDRLWLLAPEITLFVGVVVVMVLGLSPRRSLRDALPVITGVFLLAAFAVTPLVYTEARLASVDDVLVLPGLGRFVKMMVCGVGVVLAMVSVGMIDRRLEGDVRSGRLPFDPLRASRGEFYAFFLLSLIGVMLCATASDLIWLFLALELTSLPTYIMVAMSRPSPRAQEAGVKYFFLGAMAAAIFLYGFALLYGATGTLNLIEMRDVFAAQRDAGTLSLMGVVGMVLAVLGIGYKLAAAPMHFYAPDVYEGAAAPVTAFLGFVPKAAGVLALSSLLMTLGWEGGLPGPVLTTLWMMAVLTMTLGNVGALLQTSVKRMLAYSSIAHSGYLLIGVIAGPGLGLNAVLFYLLAYGLMNTGTFAVLAGLERQGHEIESMDDLAGLRQRHPGMAFALAICAGSLLGFPPLLGFIGKLYLFVAGVESGQLALVVIAGLNGAVGAWYYLRPVGLPLLAAPSARSETIDRGPAASPRLAAALAAILVVVLPLPLFSNPLLDATSSATEEEPAPPAVLADAEERR